tara:strand:- start:3350 stop:3748 length:399 start_codon:yes stop_codon:yes gene_type:complete
MDNSIFPLAVIPQFLPHFVLGADRLTNRVLDPVSDAVPISTHPLRAGRIISNASPFYLDRQNTKAEMGNEKVTFAIPFIPEAILSEPRPRVKDYKIVFQCIAKCIKDSDLRLADRRIAYFLWKLPRPHYCHQ